MQKFNCRIGLDMVFFLLLTLAFCLIFPAYLAAESYRMEWWELYVTYEEWGFFVMPIILISILIVPYFISTYSYNVTDSELQIKGFMVNEKIALDRINKVTKTTSLMSAPAGSFNRLVIHYRGGNTIQISPKNEQAFLAAIGKKLSDSL